MYLRASKGTQGRLRNILYSILVGGFVRPLLDFIGVTTARCLAIGYAINIPSAFCSTPRPAFSYSYSVIDWLRDLHHIWM